MTTHLCIHGEVFTKTKKIVDWIVSRTGWPVVTDRDLIEAAGQRFNMPPDRLEGFYQDARQNAESIDPRHRAGKGLY